MKKIEKVEKLVPNLYYKTEYLMQMRNLKQGYVLEYVLILVYVLICIG